jgi:hypothetical protein
VNICSWSVIHALYTPIVPVLLHEWVPIEELAKCVSTAVVRENLDTDSTIESAHVTIAVDDNQFIGRPYSACVATHETEPKLIN